MMRFDGKVALVTGGGRGLGRSHALLLAARGAAVVVNDLGGHGENPAADVVEEIVGAGGRAVADTGDVTTDAAAIVERAVDEFGRLDIVVNSAGVNSPSAFGPDVVSTIQRHVDVNFVGTAAVTAAAWPHLVASRAGRVVNTASPTLVGWAGESAYVASKGAVFAFTRSLAMEGLEHDVKVNAIAPSAYTRMAEAADLPRSVKDHLKANLTVEMVSPMVAFLAHDDCPVTGETLLTQGGLMQRITLTINEGYANPAVTPEDVATHLDRILDSTTSRPIGLVGEEGTGSVVDLVGG